MFDAGTLHTQNAPKEAFSYKSIIAPMPTITLMEERIVVNPKVMVGKPIIKGTRIPVDAILRRLLYVYLNHTAIKGA